MTDTNQRATEDTRRLSVLQIQRITSIVTTDYLILRAHKIHGGVEKQYVTLRLRLGKVNFQVA
jgi:hypothetical protein